MKIIQNILILIGCAVLFSSYFGFANAESPIIINQVEMSSPLKSDPKSTCVGFEPIGSGSSTQWFELKNISDKDVQVHGFIIHIGKNNQTGLQIGPDLSYVIKIKSGQKCTYSFHCANMMSSDQRCIQDTKNVIFTFEYSYSGIPHDGGDHLYSDDGIVYTSTTPPLTDEANDAKTWQLKNNKWVFDTMQASTVSPPLQQLNAGIQSDRIQCREGLILVLKTENENPACIKPQTRDKLAERNWTNSKLIKRLEIPLYTRLANAQEIVAQSMGKLPITGVAGFGGKELVVTIHEDELKRNPDAKKYYEKLIKDMLPFDVPVKITFGHATALSESQESKSDKSQYGSCPVSFMDKSQYKQPKPHPDIIVEPLPSITMMGTEYSSFEEAKKDAGLENIFLPTYMPDCLRLDSIRVSKTNPPGSITTIVYLLDGVEPKGYFTRDNVTENGVYISIQKERGIVYSYPINYVQDQARENKGLGWNYTIIKNSPVLLKNRNAQFNMPTEADLVFVHQGINVVSKILDIEQVEKITRSMLEEQ
ncbi:MAG: hypothetical protein QXN55_06950 [Candidatus Nitrosotenuis sp.]